MDDNFRDVPTTSTSSDYLRAIQRLTDEVTCSSGSRRIVELGIFSPEGAECEARCKADETAQATALKLRREEEAFQKRLTFLKLRIQKGQCSDWPDTSQFDGIDSLDNFLKAPESLT